MPGALQKLYKLACATGLPTKRYCLKSFGIHWSDDTAEIPLGLIALPIFSAVLLWQIGNHESESNSGKSKIGKVPAINIFFYWPWQTVAIAWSCAKDMHRLDLLWSKTKGQSQMKSVYFSMKKWQWICAEDIPKPWRWSKDSIDSPTQMLLHIDQGPQPVSYKECLKMNSTASKAGETDPITLIKLTSNESFVL